MKRIIKNEYQVLNKFNSKNMEITEVPPNSQIIHPITLSWIDNTKFSVPICVTKPSFDKEGVSLYKEYKCTNQTKTKYNNYLYLPPIGITAENLINIYNVETIDKLYQFINNNIDKLNPFTLNRIVNSWIRNNFETIKTYNNFLEKIYKKFLEKFYSKEKYLELTKKINLDKEIKDFIDYWFSKNNTLSFKIDLLFDLENYLEKANGKK